MRILYAIPQILGEVFERRGWKYRARNLYAASIDTGGYYPQVGVPVQDPVVILLRFYKEFGEIVIQDEGAVWDHITTGIYASPDDWEKYRGLLREWLWRNYRLRFNRGRVSLRYTVYPRLYEFENHLDRFFRGCTGSIAYIGSLISGGNVDDLGVC